MATQRVLTDDMIEAINAYIPRYPSKQAVTLPALHIVNEKLRHVPLQAVVEIAELLSLHPAQVQDTLSFYGYFKQAGPHGKCRVWVCRSISCALRGGEELLDHLCHAVGVQPGGDHSGRQADCGICGVPGSLRACAVHAGGQPVDEISLASAGG